MRDVPERCPQCHSPVAERFPHAVMYDCGFSLFNDGEPVTDDYPAECQRRRIKRLEKQLTAARAKAERWKQKYEALRAGVERVVQHLYERTRATSRDWCQSRHPYHDGASDAYCEAFLKVRRVLGEAGGGEDGPSRQDQEPAP